jgi:hypothetical protein
MIVCLLITAMMYFLEQKLDKDLGMFLVMSGLPFFNLLFVLMFMIALAQIVLEAIIRENTEK